MIVIEQNVERGLALADHVACSRRAASRSTARRTTCAAIRACARSTSARPRERRHEQAVLTAALTGPIATKADNPALPRAPEEIAAAARGA